MVQCEEREGGVGSSLSDGLSDIQDEGKCAHCGRKREWLSVADGERMGVGSARRNGNERVYL